MEFEVAKYSAVGGPKKSSMGTDGHPQGKTTAGTFVVKRCGKHSSRRYAYWSKVTWGTPLRKLNGKLIVKVKNVWKQLSEFTSVTEKEIIKRNFELYNKNELPSKWLFNDFGHMTCYVFKDLNGNRRFDRKKEKISGEFIHTTPGNEAQSAQGLSVILGESHGCVHVKPKDIDQMIRKGFLKRGNLFVVHSYTKRLPQLTKKALGRGPYEVHFYPGPKKILVTTKRK